MVIMLMPCGKSGHLELGYVRGCGKPGYILFPKEPKRLDVMYQFATDLFFNTNDLIKELRKVMNKPVMDKPNNAGAPVIRKRKMVPVVVWSKAQETR
jgi:hypothetical protein